MLGTSPVYRSDFVNSLALEEYNHSYQWLPNLLHVFLVYVFYPNRCTFSDNQFVYIECAPVTIWIRNSYKIELHHQAVFP